MLSGKKNLIENIFEDIFYRIHKHYTFGFMLLDIISVFRRDYILEKRRRGRKFIYIPLAINYLKRELLALKYFRNRVLLSKARTIFEKIISVTLTLFFSKRTKSKDFEDMQKLLKENSRYIHFRWKKKKKFRTKKFFSPNSNF